MNINRRQFLTLGGLAGASALLAGCQSPHALLLGTPTPGAWPTAASPAWRALSRLTFGPRADELARAEAIGVDAWIDEQLAPERLSDWDATLRVRRLDTQGLDASAIFGARDDAVRRELQQATLLRAIYSRRQLYELMVEFWSDHLSISTQKGEGAYLKSIDDRTVIRPHALGSFRDLLWASLHSPAMLEYLDNHQNYRGAPNENYARELMELHTLGVQAGYSQRDVQELARCLTGWATGGRLRRGQFRFDPDQHDDGAKQVLGITIPAGGGARDVELVFERLLAHPALPQFIARKLVRRFVADEPPARLVGAAAAAFIRSAGDIKAVLAEILRAPEFRQAPPRFKRPLHLVAGALRQLSAGSDAGPPLLAALARMGQPLFEWPTPDGFPDHTAAWSSNLLPRWQFALGLPGSSIAGTTLDLDALSAAAGTTEPAILAERLCTLLLGAPLPPAHSAALARLLEQADETERLPSAIAIVLASPQYQWR